MISSGVIVDSSVLLDLFTNDPNWSDWSERQLSRTKQVGPLIINSIIYSEVSIGFERIEDLEKLLYIGGFRVKEIPRESLFLAGKVFVQYRRRKGNKSSVLPDFYIGAHAAVLNIPLLTRDPGRIKTYFPKVKLITP